MCDCYGKDFYESQKVKIELTLITKVINKMKLIIKQPKENGIVSWDDLRSYNV